MIVSNCPHCHEAVRVASGELPEDAYAQCPWCHETFPLSDVLERLPPMLAVFSSDGQPITPVQQIAAAGLAAAGFGAPAAMDLDDADDTNAGGLWPEASIDSDSLQFGGDSTDAAPAMKVSPAARRSRSKGSPVRSVIGVVLGGVAAIPIAGGLLMALGKTPDWGFWPFNGESAAVSNRSAAPPPQRLTKPRKTTRLGGAESSGLTAGLNPADTAFQQITGDSLLNPESTDDPSFPEPELSEIAIDMTDLGDAETGSREDPEISEPEIVMPSPDENSSAAAPTESTEALEPRDATDQSVNIGDDETVPLPGESADEPSVDPDTPTVVAEADGEADEQVVAVLGEAGQSIEALSNFEGTEKERRRKLAQVYAKVATACEVSSSDSEGLRTLASKIASSSTVDEIAFAGAEWLDYSGRKTNGIALVGEPRGGDKPTLTLHSGKVVALMNASELPQSDRVLALGRITEDESAVEVIVALPLP